MSRNSDQVSEVSYLLGVQRAHFLSAISHGRIGDTNRQYRAIGVRIISHSAGEKKTTS